MSYQGGTTASKVDQRTPLEIKGDDILLIIAEEEAHMQLWVKGRRAVVPAASPPAVSTFEFRYVSPEVRRCQIGRGVSQGTQPSDMLQEELLRLVPGGRSDVSRLPYQIVAASMDAGRKDGVCEYLE
ncbi:hypothetical protein E4U61_001419 [Claviceps capensis]|nr:hypothetical protein E4U61_001419 [Claviceps capensis]